MRKILLLLFISHTLLCQNNLSNKDMLIFKYVKNNDIIELTNVLTQSDVNISAKDKINGYSALTLASIYGYTDVAKALIESGFDVNTQDYLGLTPLMWASFYGNTEIAKLLIDSRADVNLVGINGITALLLASNQGYTDIIMMLLDAGVNARVKYAPKSGMQPNSVIHYAKNTQVMGLLFDYDGEIDVGHNNGNSITRAMSEMIDGNVDIVKFLVEHGNYVNDSTFDLCSLLTIAIYEQNLEMINYLLSKGADITQRSQFNSPPTAATQTDNLEVVKMVFEYKKANMDIIRKGIEPGGHLQMLYTNSEEIYNYLIERGFNPQRIGYDPDEHRQYTLPYKKSKSKPNLNFDTFKENFKRTNYLSGYKASLVDVTDYEKNVIKLMIENDVMIKYGR